MDFNNESLPSVEIVKILPAFSAEEVFAQDKCYLGISLANPVFDKNNLTSLLLWASENFKQCLIVIGDELCRFNQKILYGLGEDECLNAARALGDIFIENYSAVFEQFDRDVIKISRWGEHVESDMYRKSREVLEGIFINNSEFKSMIEKDAVSFVKRQKKHDTEFAVGDDEAIDLCCKYLLEEIAVFNILSEQGWRIELYPGSELNVLAEVAKGKFPDVPQGLKNRINVELRIC